MQSTEPDLKRQLDQNKKLLEENNSLLRRLDRNARIGIWLQVLWYVFLIGMPFAVYFYILEPYFAAMGSSYETFNAGIQEIPGWKQFHELLGSYQGSEGQE
ncbi:MAG: hypothetical protein WDZ93_01760 [Candidatus Paceibacterota bacterium]